MPTAEIRITGPPGTGKTTHLAERIRKAVQAVGAKNVVVCSFTRAAAAELVGRDLPVPRENVGTLHAFAFRSLGRPTIIEASTALLGDWNRQAPRGAQIAAVNDRFGDSGPDSAEVWDGMAGASATGVLWEGYVLARHRDPSGGLVKARRQFAELDEQWGAFREETGCVDFTGLIEDALRLCPHAPGRPLVFYVDEAQDFSALELALARQWGEATGYGFVMVGDGDQCIYEWTGADPRALAAVDLPEKRRPVLAQSYRVPFEVHRHAVAWVRQTPGRIDDPEYYPRRVDPSDPTSAFAIGSVERMSSRIEDDPGGVLVLAEASLAADKSVMILATCGYMLERVVATAYDLGVPFGNRYRRRNRSWNPLAPPTRGVGLVEKVLAFLEGPEKWTARDLGKIASILKADDVFLPGRKKVAESYAKRDGADALAVDRAALELLFIPSAIEGIEARSMTWLGAHLVPKLHRRVEYLYRIAERYGLRALTHEPLLTIGTIHSVKGGEADTVLLSCGQSWAAAKEAIEERSAPLYRLMYVGMTRARERLVLCGECSFGSPSP